MTKPITITIEGVQVEKLASARDGAKLTIFIPECYMSQAQALWGYINFNADLALVIDTEHPPIDAA